MTSEPTGAAPAVSVLFRQRAGADPAPAPADPAAAPVTTAGTDTHADTSTTASTDAHAGTNTTADTDASAPSPAAPAAFADSGVAVDGGAAWTAYVAAARQLDGVRRGAAAAATEQARAVQAAREELTVVRERLAPQGARLRELGVPAMALVPSPPELSEAARTMVGGPMAVLAALRAARGWANAADGVLAPGRPLSLADWPPRARNLLVYGPLALVGPLLQLVLYAAAGSAPARVAALLCGLPLPAVAFVAGWIGVGRLFGGRADAANTAGEQTEGRVPVDGRAPGPAAGARLDRTPRWGALVCLVPVVLTTAGIILALLAE